MKIIKTVLTCTASFFITLFGILGWLLQSVLQLFSLALVAFLLSVLFIYARVKPDLDHCRQVAYDKLAQMERQDFRMLSDTEIYDKDGNLAGLINAGHYEYVPISQISLNVQNAYIAQEDRRFKSHTGVDWIATARAALALIKNRGVITQGGSTITQQVIKNTYLTQEKSFTRKVVEILLAPEIEKEYSKADIMEFYCNTNFYGNHCYGIQAASRYYFGKDALELTPGEAAVLAGISNSPSAYDPVKNPEAARDKRNDVLESMYEVGYISKTEYDAYLSQPLKIVQEEAEGTDENYMSSYAIHCAAIELMKLDHFNFRYTYENKEDYTAYMESYQALYNEKNDLIRAGGFRIYTSLDLSLQGLLQAQIDEGLSSYTELQDNGKYALQGAGVIVDNQSNYVVAIVGGRGEEDPFNRAYLSARQPGSTIKPLIDYAPAFDTGEYYPSRLVDDHKWEDGPSNSGGSYHGEVTVREALNRSLNTVAWQILEDIGVNFGLEYLGKMNFHKITYIDNNIPSLSIGGFTNGLRVVDMAKGYSTLANRGVYNDRTCILKIEHEQKGNLTQGKRPQAQQVYQEDTAYMITDILKGTLTEPFGTGHGLALSGGMPAAGKTGTTNSSKDTWFCGYTRYYTTAIWVGYDIPRAMPGIFGSTYAGRIWKGVMDELHTGKEPWDWEKPATVELLTDSKTGITDLVSTTAQLRAQQSLYDKEQRRLENELSAGVDAFEKKTIETVEDTYWVKEQYQKMISQLNLLDEGNLRGQLLERLTTRYKTFSVTIQEMDETIALYEIQRAREEAKAQERAEEEAVKRREILEIETRKNEFLTALQNVEALEYQAPNARELITTAINKLPLIADYQEAESYTQRLNTAITRISTLPTAEEWQKTKDARQAAKDQDQQALQQQLSLQQQRLEATLNREQLKWNTNIEGIAGSTSAVITTGKEK
ncbi:MAG: penicillin-binding protein [Lachnospiraceae bacterium]|jgi:penicillin-binding protein 1A|nr:penicillin-binding protein [Lachnospiraceae bacterium]